MGKKAFPIVRFDADGGDYCYIDMRCVAAVKIDPTRNPAVTFVLTNQTTITFTSGSIPSIKATLDEWMIAENSCEVTICD